MAVYTLYFKNSAVKSIRNLPSKDAEKVSLILESLKTNPFSGKKLVGEFEGLYSVRAWPYRIIYTVLKKELVVLIVDVAHRQGVYK
jgi:addiction module RelE/StbE family toxin